MKAFEANIICSSRAWDCDLINGIVHSFVVLKRVISMGLMSVETPASRKKSSTANYCACMEIVLHCDDGSLSHKLRRWVHSSLISIVHPTRFPTISFKSLAFLSSASYYLSKHLKRCGISEGFAKNLD